MERPPDAPLLGSDMIHGAKTKIWCCNTRTGSKNSTCFGNYGDSDFSFDNFHPDLLLDGDQELALRPVANSRTVQQMVYFVSAVLHEAKTR
jgi:hypothetical protein